ncbi:MAG: Flp pilus assembly complex ATPase component TadA [Candidatus Aureabacteria bacterium]|nr:Flp pilus assembly complex ATPase component TadA [Candidatus Auribacterota bacterium]
MPGPFYLIPLNDPEGRGMAPILVEKEIIAGRDEKNFLVLHDSNVSRKHVRFEATNDGLLIEDLKSANGTFINNNRIQKKLANPGDVIEIGPYRFRMQQDISPVENAKPSKPEMVATRALELSDRVVLFKTRIHEELLGRMDLKRLEFGDDSSELRKKTEEAVRLLLAEKSDELRGEVNPDQLLQEIIDEALGLGPLEDLLADPSVSEIMVNHKDQIYVEQNGKLTLSPKRFISEVQVRSVIERIVAPLGRRIDESSPLVDARLKDGSRVNAIIPPLALKGSSITIRKFSKKPFVIDDLIRFGSMNRHIAEFLKLAVEYRKNIVISGGTGSGKTTLLNVVSGFIPSDERIVTVEDAAELKLPQDHVVSLESRPPNIEGKGAITIRDLVKNCLRMRPDRIVVGECRGAEALDMLQAMNTGHDGSLTTGHANTPRDMLARLETMVLMAGMDLPSRAIREQIASAIAIIVQQSRLADGSRKITHVTEITGMENNTLTMQDIYLYKQTGFNAQGKVEGYFTATGCVPKFVEELKSRGIPVNMDLFEESINPKHS